ncbi:MAG: nucleotidyltransferase [Calditrichia bacterium]
MRKDLEQIKYILKKEFPKLQTQYNIATLELFGSYIRGKQSESSDIDILVTFTKAPSLFKFLELEEYLSNLLDIKVDLVMKKALKPNIGKRILSEAQPLL